MKKLLATPVLVLLVSVFIVLPVYANDVTVTINGQPVTFADQGPTIVNGRTLVPVAGVFQALGFNVHWDGDTRQVALTRAGDSIIITIDSNTFTANNISHSLDVPAQIIGGRTMLPIAGVLRSAGYNVDWHEATSTVLISSGAAAVAQAPPAQPVTEQAPPAQPTQPAQPVASEVELRVFELVNIERANYGLPPLVWNNTVARVAREHSIDMATGGFHSHIGSDGSNPGERLDNAGVNWTDVMENISAGHPTAEQAIAYWMGSPHHRANILRPGVWEFGAGVYNYNWTQKFAML